MRSAENISSLCLPVKSGAAKFLGDVLSVAELGWSWVQGEVSGAGVALQALFRVFSQG